MVHRLHSGLANLTEEQHLFLDRVQAVMESYFASDVDKIAQAHEVVTHVLELLPFVDADLLVTISSAYLQGIGAVEAERKYGRLEGQLLEQEGPPVARMLLADAGADENFIEQVCQLLGYIETPRGIDSPEFRLLWDARVMVGMAEQVAGKSIPAVEAILDSGFVTEACHRLARSRFLPTVD